MQSLFQPVKGFRTLLASCVAALAMAPSIGAANSADNYPERTVSIVIGFTAGGPTDVVGRILAENLSKKFNQSFIVENRPGASGSVAAAQFKRAPADGYSLMLGSSSTLSIIPHIQKDVQYDPIVDFSPVALVASYPYFLVVPAESDVQTYDDLIASGKADGAELNFASAGIGAVNHLAAEWFISETDINAVHIPYKGDSAAISDLIANRVDFAFIAGAALLPHVESGKLRALASASAVVGRGGADMLNIGDEKVEGFSAEPWNGLMAPAGLDPKIVEKLNIAVNEILNDPEVIKKLAVMEQYPFPNTPEFFEQHINEQSERWSRVIEDANIQF